jgi:cyclase
MNLLIINRLKIIMYKITCLLFLLAFNSANATDRFANVEVTSKHLGGTVYMLEGFGGNVGASIGDEGLVIIDFQYEPLAEKISATLAAINPAPIKYVVNTHYHGDHTGSNAWLREVKGATVFSHDNVRQRMASKADHKHASLPVVTFEQGVKFHFNGETISVFHLAEGHTDGDSAVMFEKANVIHAGDLFFNRRFPFVDIEAGGSVLGNIKSIETLIALSDEKTKVIPGHGELANKRDLELFVEMIEKTKAIVDSKKAKGIPLETIISEGLGDEWAAWGKNWIKEDRWITTLYQ